MLGTVVISCGHKYTVAFAMAVGVLGNEGFDDVL